MKDYLRESLTQEEKDLVVAVIWRTAKKVKQRIFAKKDNRIVPIDEVELFSEDEYNFVKIETRGNLDSFRVLTSEAKERIVKYVDDVLTELSLYKFRIALTFDEKLVLFLCSFRHYPEKKAALMLQVKLRRIKYLKESFKIKREKFLGGFKNV